MAPPIFAAISAIASPQLDAIMLAITDSTVLIPPILLIYLAYSKNRKLYPFALALLLSFSAVTLLKPIFNEARPCAELDGIHALGCEATNSFPSRHAAVVFSAVPFFSTIPMYAYALLVGLSRIYLGQHYLFDVLAGALLGLAIGYLCLRKKDWLLGKIGSIIKV